MGGGVRYHRLMKVLRITYAVALSLALFVPTVVEATTVRRVSDAELVRLADVVVSATVRQSRASWRGQRIYTQHEVVVDAVHKGARVRGAELSVLTLGGLVGEIGQRVAGSAKLKKEYRYRLHLVHHTDGFYYPVAMAQGAVELSRLIIDRPIGPLR